MAQGLRSSGKLLKLEWQDVSWVELVLFVQIV